MSLVQLFSDARMDGATLHAEIPDYWLQGRTAYGGVSGALALECVRRAFPDLPPLRSAQIAFIGPLAGAVRVEPLLLRRGRNAAYVQADVKTESALGLRATFVFMSPQDSKAQVDPAIENEAHALDEATPVNMPDNIYFTRNFEFRFALPKLETPVADVARWARLKERQGLDTMVEIIAIGDALPPAALLLNPKSGPVSSLNWQINLLGANIATRDGWWLLRSTADYARDGSSSQHMGVWNADRVQVASAVQSVALFG